MSIAQVIEQLNKLKAEITALQNDCCERKNKMTKTAPNSSLVDVWDDVIANFVDLKDAIEFNVDALTDNISQGIS